MKIIVFGSGNIGRGLIPEVFGNDNHYVFLDINQETVNKINSCKSYKINKFGTSPYVIDNFKSLNLNNDKQEIVTEIKESDLIVTAVGFNHLDSVASFLDSLKLDDVINHKIDFICFENNVRPASHMENLLKSNCFNLIDAVVDRIIPNTSKDSLDINCEEYFKVILESKKIIDKTKYKNCDIVDNLDNYIKIKLFIVNGLHFIIAILGYNKGYRKIHLTSQDHEIKRDIAKLKEIYTTYLPQMLSIDQSFVLNYFDETIKRFNLPELNDDNSRIARNMILKLQNDNRVIPIYLLAREQKDFNEFYNYLIPELFMYNNPEDDDSCKVHLSIINNGLDETIKFFSKITLIK